MFTKNSIKIVDKVPTIEIDYSSRLHHYKEQYITIFRHELEEGIRNGVFIEDEEIISYIANINTISNICELNPIKSFLLQVFR